MPEPSPPIRETTARNFLKDRTGKRIGEDAVELFVTHFTTMAEEVAVRAAELAQDGQRTTVLDRDIQKAFEAFLGASGLSLLSPATIHTAIDGISNESLSQLIQSLRADLEHP